MSQKEKDDQDQLAEHCLAAFIGAGSLDLSLDQLAIQVGISKRMLIHYFGSREQLEEHVMTLLEDRLRAQFASTSFPGGASPQIVVMALWAQATAPRAKGVLLLIMDLNRRAWSGSSRARAFYRKQQRHWVKLLTNYLPAASAVEEFLQLFQGAILAYLVTGDRERGRRALANWVATNKKPSPDRKRTRS